MTVFSKIHKPRILCITTLLAFFACQTLETLAPTKANTTTPPSTSEGTPVLPASTSSLTRSSAPDLVRAQESMDTKAEIRESSGRVISSNSPVLSESKPGQDKVAEKFAALESTLNSVLKKLDKLTYAVGVLEKKKHFAERTIPKSEKSAQHKTHSVQDDLETSEAVSSTSTHASPPPKKANDKADLGALEGSKKQTDRTSDFSEEDSFAEEAVPLNSRNALAKANFFYNKKQYTDAINMLRDTKNHFPGLEESESFLLLLAKCHFADENEPASLDALGELFLLKPSKKTRVEGLLLHGKILVQLGQISQAQKSFRDVISLNPKSEHAKEALRNLEEIKQGK